MFDQRSRNAMDSALRNACNVLVDHADLSDVSGVILAMLLLKYLSDTRKDLTVPCLEQGADMLFVVPSEAHFEALLETRDIPGIGIRIDEGLCALERANVCLQGIFQNISFDASVLGNTRQRDRLLGQLLGVFATIDFRNCSEEQAKMVAYACDFVIQYVGAAGGKKGGEFITPADVCQLIARLVQPKEGETVGDPFCGSGSLLIACSQQAYLKSGRKECTLFGQEINGKTWALAKMNMVLHGETKCELLWGDTLREPKLLHNSTLRKFEVVVSSPPFSMRDWGHEQAVDDMYNRYWRGIPPRTTGDYAFLSHMVETLHPTKGRMVAVVSLGVLFRGATEHDIRKKMLQENLIDAVISLPPKMFPHTGIAVALLVFRKQKTDENVLFIDASGSYQHGKTQNILREEDLDRIESTYHERKDVDRYARLVSREDVFANDCNLAVTRYVHVVEDEEDIDLFKVREERVQLTAELAALEVKLATLLGRIPLASESIEVQP